MTSVYKKWKQFAVGVAASLGYASQGLAAAFPSSALPHMTERDAEFYVSEQQAAIIVAVLYLSAAFGNLTSGYFLNRIGRKYVLLGCSVPILIGFTVTAASTTWVMMVSGRALIGFFVGTCLPASSVYISESIEPGIRGTVAATSTLMFLFGNLLEYFIGYLAQNWRLLAWINIFLPILFIIAVLPLHETPRYLLSNGKETEALESLIWLRERGHNCKEELQGIKNFLFSESTTDFKYADLLTKHNLKMFSCVLTLVLLFASSGGSTLVMLVGPLITKLDSKISPDIVAVVVGIVQILGISVNLSLIDRIGRRRLLQISGALMTVFWSCLCIYSYMMPSEGIEGSHWNYLPSVFIVLLMFSYCIGYFPVTTSMISELLPCAIRGCGTSCLIFIGSIVLSLFSYAFLLMISRLGSTGTFLYYSCVCFFGFLFPTFFILETKGKSLEEIEVQTRNQGIFMGLTPMKSKENDERY